MKLSMLGLVLFMIINYFITIFLIKVDYIDDVWHSAVILLLSFFLPSLTEVRGQSQVGGLSLTKQNTKL